MYNFDDARSYTVSGVFTETGITQDLLDNSDPPDSRESFDITYRCSVEWADIVYWYGWAFRLDLDIYAMHDSHAYDQLFKWESAWYGYSMAPPPP